jgi:two-component system, OmpR family, response regulator
MSEPPALAVNGVFLEYGDKRIRLRRQQAIMLELMIPRLGKAVRKGAIYEALYSTRPNGGPSSAVVEVLISQLRSRFRDLNIGLEIITHHGIGWELRCLPDRQ